VFAFSALTPFVGHQEEHLACKNWVMRCRHGYLYGAIKIQNGLTFLVPAYPGCPGKRDHYTGNWYDYVCRIELKIVIFSQVGFCFLTIVLYVACCKKVEILLFIYWCYLYQWCLWVKISLFCRHVWCKSEIIKNALHCFATCLSRFSSMVTVVWEMWYLRGLARV